MIRTLAGIFADTVTTLLTGWVITWLWLWFLIPLGLPAIGIAHAIGIAVIIGVMTNQYIPGRDSDEEVLNLVGHGIAHPLIALVIGYIAHSFM